MPSHKTLKSVVRSLAESYTSLMNHWYDDYVMGHIVWAAWQSGATSMRADLLSRRIDPSPLWVLPAHISINSMMFDFPDLVARSNSSVEFIKSAELIITVDPTMRRPHEGTDLWESPFTCTVTIVDDRGKTYSHTIADWWYPERNPNLTKQESSWQKCWRRLTSGWS